MPRLGPILAVHAARNGVVVTTCDGDQPAVQINLHRFVRGLGLVPRVMGNIKGLQDRYRTPITQKRVCREVGPEAGDGHRVRRRLEGELRAGDRRQCHRTDRGQARHARATTIPAHVDALTTRYDLDLLRDSAGSSSTWSAPSPARESSAWPNSRTCGSGTT